MKNADMPAMPQPIAANETEVIDTNEYCPGNAGLTKREHFAGLAMQGLLSSTLFTVSETPEYWMKDTIEAAVEFADALLIELEKKL